MTNKSILTLQRTRLHSIPVRLAVVLLLWEQFDEVIDTENGDGCLCGKLQALCFDCDGLIHACLTVVSRFAVHQVQTNPATNTEINMLTYSLSFSSQT